MSEINRPAEKYSTQYLINALNVANKFIADANNEISGQGGWIAREANWEEIDRAKNEIRIIEHELSLRK